LRDKLNNILSERTGQPLDVIERDTERDNFMTAERALEYGLVDKILDRNILDSNK
jgi:ATP-dependent Clp protease, protease subunit